MATKISELAITVGVDGSKAEAGLERLAAKVEGFASSIQTAGKILKGFAITQIAKEAFEAAAAFGKFVDESDKVSKSLGVMFGNIGQGSDIFNHLSELSAKTGADFGSLVKQMEGLSAAGFGLGKSLQIIKGAGELDWLFGGNGQGVEAIAGGIAKLNGELAGTATLFDQLKSKGIDAYQELGKAIGVSANEAERLLKAGRITGFQAAQAAAGSLNSPDAMAKRREADTISGRLGQWTEPGKKIGQIGDKIWNDELATLRSFVSNFFAPFGDAAKTIEAGKVSLGGVANERAEYMRQLTGYFKKVEESLSKAVKSPLDNLLDQFALLDSQIRLANTDARFKQVGDLAKKRKEQLIEEFSKVTLNSYEELAKQVLDTRVQIEAARKNKQEALAQEIEKRLKAMAPRYSTADGPLEGMVEKLQFGKKDAQQAVDKFGDQGQVEKFNQEVREFLKSIRPGPDGPISALIAGFGDLDKAAERLADLAKNDNLFDVAKIKEGIELIKAKQERLLQEFEAGTLTPYEKFVKDSAKIAKGLADAAADTNKERGARTAEALRRQQRKLDEDRANQLDPTLTDFERFNKERWKLEGELAKANANGDQIGIRNFERQLGEIGRKLADSLPQIGDSFFADTVESNSLEAYRAEMRAKFGDGSTSIQERIAQATERQERLSEQILEEQRLAREALAGMGPAPAPWGMP